MIVRKKRGKKAEVSKASDFQLHLRALLKIGVETFESQMEYQLPPALMRLHESGELFKPLSLDEYYRALWSKNLAQP